MQMTAAQAQAPPSAPAAGWEGWSDRLEVALGAALMFAATSPGLLLAGVSEDPNVPLNPIFRLVWLPVYAGTMGLALWRAPRLARAWAPCALCALMVAWAAASQHWSILPDVTHRRVVALAFTTLLGVCLGAVFAPRRFVEMLAAAFLALAVGSLLVAVLDPKIGVMALEGQRDWRGLFPHKNGLAFHMALGALAAACAAATTPRRARLWWATAALCLVLLLLSRGKTSLVAAALVLAGAGFLALLRRGGATAVAAVWAGATLALAGGVTALLAPAAVLRALGKDPTLTGRTDIWAAVLRAAQARPWLGYGYAAFWDKQSAPARLVQKETHWLVPSAHNGWLDLLVQVGWVGVGLFAAVALLALAVLAVRFTRSRDGGFGLLYLVLFGFLSLSESVIEDANTLSWALFVAVVVRALAPRAYAAAPARAPLPAPPPIWRDAPLPAPQHARLHARSHAPWRAAD